MAHHFKDLTIELDEKVGSVAAAAEALGKAGVNLNTVYLATKTRVVIGAGEIEKARTAAGEGAASVR